MIAPSALWNTPPSNPDFTGASGTSFSAPHVAGAMTLLEGAGIGDPMAQRAILINSARDWNGMNTGLEGWAAPQTGWRPEVGWGELDLAAALAERGNYQLGSVRGGEAAFYRATVPTGAKATLAYELRGFFVGFPNPGTQTIKYTQSNLDLRQYLASGVEVVGPPDPEPGAARTPSTQTTPSSRCARPRADRRRSPTRSRRPPRWRVPTLSRSPSPPPRP